MYCGDQGRGELGDIDVAARLSALLRACQSVAERCLATETQRAPPLSGRSRSRSPSRKSRRCVRASRPSAVRAHVAEQRWPNKETVADQSQGVQLSTIQDLVHYWGTQYDWRRCEAHLNALPQFMIEIDGLDIHFIHVRSQQEDALPLIVNHGWPGSVIEQLQTIDPLPDPTTHGASAADAFHVVIPSMPGYGFRASRRASAGPRAHGPSPGQNS